MKLFNKSRTDSISSKYIHFKIYLFSRTDILVVLKKLRHCCYLKNIIELKAFKLKGRVYPATYLSAISTPLPTTREYSKSLVVYIIHLKNYQ